jgi:hypothetical protein
MVPSCATAGELKMMSPVAYAHLRVPSGPIAYSLPSWDPTSTEPSAATAGDDTMGADAVKVHEIAGFTAGSTKGERPRWVAPRRNIAWAGSIAYCGSGNAGAPGTAPAAMARVASTGHRQRPASQSRLSLQSLSDAQGDGSTWAHAASSSVAPSTAAPTVARFMAGDGRDVRMAQG